MTEKEPNKSKNSATDILGKELVWTPELKRLAQQVGYWLRLELPGAYVYGVQRNGKSSALRWIASMTNELFGRAVFVSLVNIQKGLADRETSLPGEWLNQAGKLSNENTPARLRKRLKAHFVEEAQQRDNDQIVLVVDEAQNLTRNHLGQLIYWGDVLAAKGLRVFTLLVDQPELRTSIDSYLNMGELQIVGRFFERSHEFQAIAQSDIDLVIKAHECDVLCSDGTVQPPAVAGLFPEAWAKGWRPSAWSATLGEGIRAAAIKCGLAKDQRVPMQHLRSTLIGMLLYAKALNDPHAPMTANIVTKALTDTGLTET